MYQRFQCALGFLGGNAALSLIAVAFGMACISGYCQEFEAEGTIAYTVVDAGDKVPREVRQFALARDGVFWKIQTAAKSSHGYDEMGCDGVHLFQLNETGKKRPDLSQWASATGRVLPLDHMPFADSGYIYPVWLAYCAGPYLNGVTNSLVAAPFFYFGDFYTIIPKPLDMPASWTMQNSNFAGKIVWKAEGVLNEHNEWVKSPPWDKPFVQATYEVISWTNFGRMQLPKSFELTVYRPDEKTNKPLIRYRLTGKIDLVRDLGSFSPLPALTGETIITDSRVFVKGAPIRYHSATNWLNPDGIEDRIKARHPLP